MRKIKQIIYFNANNFDLMHKITMTTDEGHFYLLWNESAIQTDTLPPIFKDKSVDEMKIIFANLALDRKEHPPLTKEEETWMIENFENRVGQT